MLTGKKSGFLLLASHSMAQELGPTSAPSQVNILCCSIDRSRVPSCLLRWVNTLRLVCELGTCFASPAKRWLWHGRQRAGRSSPGGSQGSQDWKKQSTEHLSLTSNTARAVRSTVLLLFQSVVTK